MVPEARPSLITWQQAPGLLVWAVGTGALLALDGKVDLANLAMLLVMSSALATLWLPARLAAAAGTLAVLAFNWRFVPPRGSLMVDLRQHALLLLSMLLVNLLVVALMQRLRQQAEQAAAAGRRESRLRAWSDTLRDADEPLEQSATLLAELEALAGTPVALMALDHRQATVPPARLTLGQPDADQSAGLALCLGEGHALGPGSGRFEALPDAYLPLRGRGRTLGAVVLCGLGLRATASDLHTQAQTLCDLFGQALQRTQDRAEARRALEQAQLQSLRNALLSAIAHDHRTPLAAILGAASSLQQQGGRMDEPQRQRLLQRIVDEADRLRRLTDNTLQLARLDAPGLQLSCDWESVEDLVGAALRRARSHDPQRRLRARLDPGLPLLWCDALLVSQALDNLIDNALKYSPADAPVELRVQARDDAVTLAVRDRGPGVPTAWRQQVFEPFWRGAVSAGADAASPARAGAGVGLALCRAIARVHGGELRLRPRGHGGSSFELQLPRRPEPAVGPEAA